jgi:hypothetical protein
VCSNAYAAKAHRTAKKELTPKLAEGSKGFKATCGCTPKMLVDWKAFNATKADKAGEYAKSIGYEIKYAGEQAKAFCSDGESKKLFCSNIKKIVIVPKGISEADAKHDPRKKVMMIFTSEQMNSGGYKMKSIMEEW